MVKIAFLNPNKDKKDSLVSKGIFAKTTIFFVTDEDLTLQKTV